MYDLSDIGRAIGMARGKRRLRVVLETKLDRLSRRLASNLGHHAEAKINSGRNAARGDDIAVLDDAGFLMRGANQWQQLGKCPVCRGATAFLAVTVGVEMANAKSYRRYGPARISSTGPFPDPNSPEATGGGSLGYNRVAPRM